MLGTVAHLLYLMEIIANQMLNIHIKLIHIWSMH